jgi:hypothetical protein
VFAWAPDREPAPLVAELVHGREDRLELLGRALVDDHLALRQPDGHIIGLVIVVAHADLGPLLEHTGELAGIGSRGDTPAALGAGPG